MSPAGTPPSRRAGQRPAGVLPALGPASGAGTRLVLAPAGPLALVLRVAPSADGVDPAEAAAVLGVPVELGGHGPSAPSLPVLPESGLAWQGRPALRGHRADGSGWTTRFATTDIAVSDSAIVVEATDSGLALRTEFETLPGGALRARHVLTNTDPSPYIVDGLDVVVPLPDGVGEILDLTGRWALERAPQRHRIHDGIWLRESRGGRPGHDAATQLLVGTEGFGFGAGHVWAVHVAWSGNSELFVERRPSGLVTVGGGELLLPGEIVLDRDESYTTPWVVVAASADGMDGAAAQLHGYARSLAAHPVLPRPVVSNVWEAVYFDHDLTRLRALADVAAEIGIERFVLDDGWFGDRRDDTRGLGDWSVSADVWPDGLGPLVDHVRSRGLSFGLWFEPEMINPDSELFRAHPDWILGAPDQPLSRHQLVLDLGREEVRDHLFSAMDSVLSAYPIDYVKWDHNRELHDASAGSLGRAGAHATTVGYYELLDRLRAAHPAVEWESCASGGGRIDLGVLERVERVWTSDVTDALSRQHIQRWTTQLIPPEYVGAHVSAPANHQTGRAFDLNFRAATAFFGDFGVEWDVSSASPAERAQLAQWIASYQRHRALLHSGRTVRVDTADDRMLRYAVVAADDSAAIAAYVQLDEVVADPPPFVVRGLDRDRRYTARTIGPLDATAWRGEGLTLSGAALATIGLPAPSRRPASAWLIHLTAAP